MRTIASIIGNSQRLDGGAMFGNAPRAVWQRWIAPDAQNRIPLACRAMLIRDGDRTILLETGIGAFFEPKLRARFGVMQDRHVLLDSLAAAGVAPGDVDVLVLSHLHFDHAGGLLTPWAEGEAPRLLFENATFVVGRAAWDRALKPHPRDRASFIPELQPLLTQSGRLEIVEGDTSTALDAALGASGYRLHFSDGHTPGLMLVEVASDEGPIVFAGDLIPGRAWVHAPITMGYDRYPELLIDEKTRLLDDLVQRGGRVFFTHDSEVAMARVVRDARGRFTVGEAWPDPQGLAI
ncbi:MAG: glyoxylase-like metal-dependent hydrolase (beta-lactamase superfamily II) [Bradymonadia bacterium]|jgi:glyoxylase-like metal-dependent hydrolase (beta-lactamase superfamily II)